tara:strand:+ start:594 stop:1178 length:585 start_codon:yes stop_codon:yes gene_type:complete
MGEQEIRISISRRSVAQVAPYESEEASASVELSLEAGTSAEDVIAELKAWGDRIATANFEALGIGYEIDEVAVRRLQKSLPADNTSSPVAAAPKQAASAPTKSAPADETVWRDIMDNSDNWFVNWPDIVSGVESNAKRPAYRKKGPNGTGVWLVNQDNENSAAFPEWFVCPKTGKGSEELLEIGRQIKQKSFAK